MTLIVGIFCREGVVVAADSTATFAKEGIPTIGQQEISKVIKLSDCILFSNTGAVGMGQLVAHEIECAWERREFVNINKPAEMMNCIGKKISQLIKPYLETANLTRSLVGDVSMSLCKSLVAMPVAKIPCLFTFDYNGAPEQASAQLPFVSLGSAQPIADPFLALLKRLLWPKSQPTLAEGRLVVVWTIDHARLTNPGGVGGRIQLATLAPREGKPPSVTILSEDDVQEHLQQIRAADDLPRAMRRHDLALSGMGTLCPPCASAAGAFHFSCLKPQDNRAGGGRGEVQGLGGKRLDTSFCAF